MEDKGVFDVGCWVFVDPQKNIAVSDERRGIGLFDVEGDLEGCTNVYREMLDSVG